MPLRVDSVPPETDLLCESCGYALNGLPDAALCPECGAPAADSLHPDSRRPTQWESGTPKSLAQLASDFSSTTLDVLTHPGSFFRALRTRSAHTASRNFALLQHVIAAYFFSIAAAMHLLYLDGRPWDLSTSVFGALLGAAALTPLVFGIILFIRLLAGLLTTIESRWHAMRLPAVAVSRALHYHAAALFPISVLSATFTLAYRILLATNTLPRSSSELPYLYALSAWVIVAATYLFWSYWQAMKNIRYANR